MMAVIPAMTSIRFAACLPRRSRFHSSTAAGAAPPYAALRHTADVVADSSRRMVDCLSRHAATPATGRGNYFRTSCLLPVMPDLTVTPWPWYVSGALIGLVVPVLLLVGGKQFGVSANLRHLCAMGGARRPLFRYDWRRDGGWNLIFAAGLVLGGVIAGAYLRAEPVTVAISPATVRDLQAAGVTDLGGFAPPQLVSWAALGTLPGVLTLVLGGFLVGFGARWAGGCTSGHAISGLSARQWPSLLAVAGFFAGGLLMTHLIWPFIL